MAALISRPDGTYWIQLRVGATRKTLRLGRLSRKAAEDVRRRVESLQAFKLAGLPPDEGLMIWLRKLDPVVAKRLATLELLEQVPCQRLGEFMSYVFGRLDVKTSTRTSYENVRRNLLDYFGADKPIAAISPGDGEEFRQWLAKHNEVRSDGVMSKATVIGRTRRARQFFNLALRKRWIQSNPFAEVRISGNQANEAKQYYVPAEHIEALLPELPDNEYRLIVAFGRFAGLRVPSEPLALRWENVDWSKGTISVVAPKTGLRVIPIFERIRPLLELQWDAAGSDPWVIAKHRISGQAISSIVTRAIGRTGVPPWPKLFQNLRASAETDLMEKYPLHVVCAWIGNSPRIAAKHYLMVTHAHIASACGRSVGSSPEPQPLVNQANPV